MRATQLICKMVLEGADIRNAGGQMTCNDVTVDTIALGAMQAQGWIAASA